MANLSLKTIGIRGGVPQYKEKVGYITAFLRHSEDRIEIDDFEGFESSYKKREMTNIQIVHNGKVLFNGNKYELFDILEGYNSGVN